MVVEQTVGKRSCIKKTFENQNSSLEVLNSTDGKPATKLPGVDIFLNPAKQTEKTEIVAAKQGIAKAYFKSSNMADLYPNLFRILWQSTLPCFKVKIANCKFTLIDFSSSSKIRSLRGSMITFCLTVSLLAQRFIYSMLIHSSFEGKLF